MTKAFKLPTEDVILDLWPIGYDEALLYLNDYAFCNKCGFAWSNINTWLYGVTCCNCGALGSRFIFWIVDILKK